MNEEATVEACLAPFGDLDGVEVMRQIHTHIPQLPTIIMSVDRMQDLSSIEHFLNSSE